MAQRRQERTVLVPGEKDDEESEEGSAEGEANNDRGERGTSVGGVGEVLDPPAVGNATGEGEGGASKNIRTGMEVMEVGSEATEKGDDVEAKEEDVEAQGRE